jgi:hypothetical protein
MASSMSHVGEDDMSVSGRVSTGSTPKSKVRTEDEDKAEEHEKPRQR